MVLGGKVQLITINVHGNLHVPLVSKNPYDIRAWNGKVDEYIVGVFDFD
jgi:homogentisate 1,2-dioxygenase